MIQMIASDLDGTLLKQDWSISSYNVDVIKAAEEKGIRWITVTGRSFGGAYPILSQYDIKCDYVLMNGAEFRTAEGKIIFAESMDTFKARVVCKRLKEEGLDFEINTDHGDFMTKEGNPYAEYLKDGFEQLFENDFKIRKILCFCQDISKLDRLKKEIYEELGLSVLSSFATNMEVTAPLAKKGIMLKRVAEYYGLKAEDIAVFGDGENDISMFQSFPVSFAMKNGVEQLKNIAAYITDFTNEEDGVGRTVKEQLL
jgi:Cof subfamily protein (haloacid dehalogenase superfamily)